MKVAISQKFFNPIVHGGALCARTRRRSLGIPWWMPQMSSYFINLKILKNRKKIIFPFLTPKGWKKNQKIEKKKYFY